MKRAVIWGAGHIGRGFVAGILREGGYWIDFVDRDAALVEQLARHGAYTVYKATPAGVSPQRVEGGFSAFHTSDAPALERLFDQEALLVDIAVFKNDLASVADMLFPLVERRARLIPESKADFLMNVNMTRPDEAFRQLMRERLSEPGRTYFDANCGVSGIFAMCISPATPAEYLAEDPLALLNNDFFEQAISRPALRGPLPEAPRLRLSDRLEAEESRKLYTLNMAHCAAAYLGAPRGFSTSWEAVRDPEVRASIGKALEEASLGVSGEFGFSPREMQDWRETIFSLLDNPYIADGLDRLGADTARKLGPGDRLVVPAALCLKYGGKPHALAKVLRFGYEFEHDDPGTRSVRRLVREEGLPRALEAVSGLSPESELYQMILRTNV